MEGPIANAVRSIAAQRDRETDFHDIPSLKVRNNERGSISVGPIRSESTRLVVRKQTSGGNIETEWEISLHPGELLHIEAPAVADTRSEECCTGDGY